jgi:hypothetical protein
MAGGFDSIKPAGVAWPVTPSDATVFKQKTRALYVGGAGNVAVNMFNSETGKMASVTLTEVAAGTTLAVETDMVLSTNTTATNITALA